jgi:ribosomal protein L16 Arg81 hydroxylase
MYLSHTHTQTFDYHYDLHDLFILQIYGKKTWYIYDSITELPSHYFKRRPKVNQELYNADNCKTKININAGDTLYFPRGQVHCVFSDDSPSIHLAVGLHPVMKYDFLDAIKDYAIDQPFFRKSFPYHQTQNHQTQAAAELKKELIDFIRDLPNQQLIDFFSQKFANEKHQSFKQLFKDSISKHQIDENTIFKLRSDVTYFYQIKDNHLELRFSGIKSTLPPLFQSIIEYILKGESFTVKDLPTPFPNNLKLHTIKQLLGDGLISIEQI